MKIGAHGLLTFTSTSAKHELIIVYGKMVI